MKYLFSFLLVTILSLNGFAQKPLDFKADLQSTKFEALKIRGFSLGIVHKSNWLVQYDLESRNREAANLPDGYNGWELEETFLYHSLSIGRVFNLNEKKSFRMAAKIGVHSGKYTGFDNFETLPEQDDLTVGDALDYGVFGAIILLPIALADHLDDQTHSFDQVNQKLKGMNGEILLEYEFDNHIVLGVGCKWMRNKRINDFGRTIKLGVQF